MAKQYKLRVVSPFNAENTSWPIAHYKDEVSYRFYSANIVYGEVKVEDDNAEGPYVSV